MSIGHSHQPTLSFSDYEPRLMHRDVSRKLHHRRMEVHLKGGNLLRTLHFAERNRVEVRADAVVVLKGTFRKGKYNAKSW